jgi:hypothetical protein
MRLRSAIPLSAVLLLTLASCTDEGYSITDNSNRLTVTPLYFGAEEDFLTGFAQVPFVAEVGGTPVTATWVSSDPGVATINPATGLATPVTSGFTAITATVGSRTKSASLTVLAIPGVQITSGQVLANQGGATGASLLYWIYVPAGTTNITASLSGGTGDIDLFMRVDDPPDYGNYDCVSAAGGNNESCSIADPDTGGLYFIWLDVYALAANATLVVTLTP